MSLGDTADDEKEFDFDSWAAARTKPTFDACAKAGVVHYTRCLAAEVREAGVRVNCVSPGPAKTARFLATRGHEASMMKEGPSLRRYATAEEVADAVAFLVGDRARFISGQVLRVDGAAGLYAA